MLQERSNQRAATSDAARVGPSSQEAVAIQGRALSALRAAITSGASTKAVGPDEPPRAVVAALEAVEDSINSVAELDDLVVFLPGHLGDTEGSTPSWTRPCGETRH